MIKVISKATNSVGYITDYYTTKVKICFAYPGFLNISYKKLLDLCEIENEDLLYIENKRKEMVLKRKEELKKLKEKREVNK